MIADRFVQFGQNIRVEIVTQDINDVGPVISAQVFQQISRVRRMKLCDQLTNAPLVTGDKDL